jgi:hypothetical protein
MFLMEDGLVCELLGIVAGTNETNTEAFWGRIFEPAARQCERCIRGVCANRTLHRQRYVDRDEVLILGMASRLTINIEALFWTDGLARAAIVHEIKVNSSGGKSFKIVLSSPRGPLHLGATYRPTEWEMQSAAIVTEGGLGNSSLSSDGGWKQTGSFTQRLLERRLRCESAASLVCIPKSQSHVLSIKLEGVERTHPTSAFNTELLGIAMSSDLRLRCWWEHGKLMGAASDCKSAINVSNKYWQACARVNLPTFALTQFINRHLAILCEESEDGAAQVRWVRAHAERRGTWESWSHDELAMVMADEVASGHKTAVPHIPNNSQLVPVETFLRHMESCPGSVVLTRAGGIILESLKEVGAQNCRKVYLRERDDRRVVKGKSPKWAGSTCVFAARIWGLASKGLVRRFNAVRHIYDRYMHNGNVAKYKNDSSLETCPLCGGTDNQDHYARQCSHPDIVNTRGEGLVPLQNLVAKAIKTCPRLGEFAIQLQRIAIGKFTTNPDEQLDAFHGISLWSGMCDVHTERAIESMARGLLQDDRSQSAALSFTRRFCSILTDVMSKVWKKRCQLWTDPDSTATELAIPPQRERRTTQRSREVNPARRVVDACAGNEQRNDIESYKFSREIERKKRAFKAMKKSKVKDKTGEEKRHYKRAEKVIVSTVYGSRIASLWKRSNDKSPAISKLINVNNSITQSNINNNNSNKNKNNSSNNTTDIPLGVLRDKTLCGPNGAESTMEPGRHKERGDRNGIG